MLELVRAGSVHRIEWIKETPVLRLRRELLPLIYLNDDLRLDQSKPDHGYVVVMQVGNQVFGLVVDGLFHTEEIVIKPMSSKLRYISAFSGTTILGDGAVIMIIDPNGMFRRSAEPAPVLARTQGRPRQEEMRQSPAIKFSLRSWFSAPVRSSRKRYRYRSYRGLRKSIADELKSPTTSISSNAAVSSCRFCASMRRRRSNKTASSRSCVFSGA